MSIRYTCLVFILSWVVALNNGFTGDTGLEDIRLDGFGNAYTEVEQFNNRDFLSTLKFLYRTRVSSILEAQWNIERQSPGFIRPATAAF